MDIKQAIHLRKKLQTTHPIPVQILGVEKGYVLSISELLIDAAIFTFIEQFAEEHKLSLTLKQGYWMLVGHHI